MGAEEMRRTLQSLGMTSMDELVGAAGDVLEVDPAKLRSNGRPDKAMGLDLAPLLQSARELNPTAGYRHTQLQDHELGIKADNELMDAAHSLIETYAKGGSAEPIVIERETNNLDRTLGTMLSAKVSKACGKPGLPDDAVRIKLEGSSVQSLGFALAPGITIEVVGDANDGCGKGLSGGRVIVRPNPTQLEGGHFIPSENVIVGNVACYGATAGEAFFRGVGGERFCVRNSGALAVVEGVGDHGCEYMTGGRMVCLGKTGRNFAAGMSGGIAYVYDPERKFPARCNMGLVGLEVIDADDEKEQVFGFIQEHVAATGSSLGAEMLENWDSRFKDFVKVYP